MFFFGFMRVSCVVALLAVGGIISPPPAQASPEDQPAIEQYADPFGPLPTRERAREFNPLSDEAAVPPSPQLLHQLERVDEANRAPLASLVSQLATARKRVSEAGSADASSPRPESHARAVEALADSLFDFGGSGGWLLAAAGLLAVVATAGTRRRLVRDRRRPRPPE